MVRGLPALEHHWLKEAPASRFPSVQDRAESRPRDHVLDDVVSVREQAACPNDAMSVRESVKGRFIDLPESPQSFANDLELTLDDQLESAVRFDIGEQLCQR